MISLSSIKYLRLSWLKLDDGDDGNSSVWKISISQAIMVFSLRYKVDVKFEKTARMRFKFI